VIHIIAFNLFLACCLLYSFKNGGEPEKAAMLAQFFAAVLTITAIHFLPHSASFTNLAHALAVIDGALLLSLVGLALRANRLWTILLAGLQLSTVVVHLSKAVFPALPAASYGFFAQFWAWPMLITTAVGTHAHRMRTKKFGEERDWKPLWPHSVRAHSTA
jgi:hypothetical protein